MCFIASQLCLLSQTKKELENKKQLYRQKLKSNILFYENIKKKKNVNLETVNFINANIDTREQLVNELDDEISDLKTKINKDEESISKLEEKRKIILNNLKSIIYTAYKTKNTTSLMLILSSKNVNEAYDRIQFFKNIKISFNNKLSEIQVTENQLNSSISSYKSTELKKSKIMLNKADEVAKLKKEKDEKETILRNLSKKEKELKALIEEQKRVENELELKIKEITENEIKSKNVIYNKLTPEEKTLSQTFEKNKGKLPWPTLKGIIVSYYGKHEHPVLKGIYVNNNGIDIATENSSIIRAVFDGTVTKVFKIKGSKLVIIIRHGNFLTVYQNLTNIYVKNGQKVNTKQDLGNVLSEQSNDITTLHFEIWEELIKKDPLEWLSK
jgi:murein hydrolase activator